MARLEEMMANLTEVVRTHMVAPREEVPDQRSRPQTPRFIPQPPYPAEDEYDFYVNAPAARAVEDQEKKELKDQVNCLEHIIRNMKGGRRPNF